jgi:hypothetical protein
LNLYTWQMMGGVGWKKRDAKPNTARVRRRLTDVTPCPSLPACVSLFCCMGSKIHERCPFFFNSTYAGTRLSTTDDEIAFPDEPAQMLPNAAPFLPYVFSINACIRGGRGSVGRMRVCICMRFAHTDSIITTPALTCCLRRTPLVQIAIGHCETNQSTIGQTSVRVCNRTQVLVVRDAALYIDVLLRFDSWLCVLNVVMYCSPRVATAIDSSFD